MISSFINKEVYDASTFIYNDKKDPNIRKFLLFFQTPVDVQDRPFIKKAHFFQFA